jgi:hypothetical protein
MTGGTLTSAASLATVADLNWKIAAVGDFDGDSKSDILWHNNATGQNQIWFMNGGTLTTAAWLATTADLNWSLGTAPLSVTAPPIVTASPIGSTTPPLPGACRICRPIHRF